MIWLLTVLEMGILITIIHESTHAITALLLGVKIKTVGVTWKGVYIRRSIGSDIQNLLITLSAPCMNLFIALATFYQHIWIHHFVGFFIEGNIIFFIVNMLPFSGSDGKRAWNCIRKMRKTSI